MAGLPVEVSQEPGQRDRSEDPSGQQTCGESWCRAEQGKDSMVRGTQSSSHTESQLDDLSWGRGTLALMRHLEFVPRDG